MKATKQAPRNWQGMNWITQVKRLAIYLRDGLACAYCGQSVEQGARLTIDHVRCHDMGGTNDETNLVTACERCNKSKNARSLNTFAHALAAYLNHGLTAESIKMHVRKCTARSLNPHRAAAKNMIAERGSASKALAAI